MSALKFTVQGETAFFKKPDVNSFMYFTYGNIHKVALLGMLGAMIGYGGYSEQEDAIYPSFYEKLKDLQIAIVPRATKKGKMPGVFGKKVQTFNNSVGYASGEAGGNLIVKEQWLEKPSWDIYIKDNHPSYSEIASCIMERRCVYMPYLGKNDHFAMLLNPCEVTLKEVKGAHKIDSLFIKEDFTMGEVAEDDFFAETEPFYKYEEKLPIGLEPEHNQYELKSFVLTNKKMMPQAEVRLYQAENQIIYFF